MADKDFKTIKEQLEILRISGYSLTLRKNNVFSQSAAFQNIVDIYHFDHEFRHIILQYLEVIEVQMKSIYTYEFTKIHGPAGYLDHSFFTNQTKHKEIIIYYLGLLPRADSRHNTVGGLEPGFCPGSLFSAVLIRVFKTPATVLLPIIK